MVKQIIDHDAAKRKFDEDMAAMRRDQPPAGPQEWRLPAARFGLAGHFRGENVCATFPADKAYADALKPSTWSLVANRVVPGTLIEVRDDNLSWFALLIVVAVTPSQNFVEVRELFHKEIQPAMSRGEERSGYKSEYRGVTDRWVVIRTSDGKIMCTGLATPEEARHQIGQLEAAPIGAPVVGRHNS